MLIYRNFGFSCLILEIVVAFVLCSSIYLAVRHKWRIAAKKKKEIQRLLVLAAEEAARIETEVDCSHVYLKTIPLKSNILLSSLCVVCYAPTSTRCSRCKGAKYCSGKCQIIHWREGHRYQCHPPSTTINDNLNSVDINLTTEEQDVKHIDTTDKPLSSSFVTASENLSESQSSSCESLPSGCTSPDLSDLPSIVPNSRKPTNISDGNRSENITTNVFENLSFGGNPSPSEKIFPDPTKVVDSANNHPSSVGCSGREGTLTTSVSPNIDQFDCTLSPKIPTISSASQGRSFCVGKSLEAVDEICFNRTKDEYSSNVGGFLQFSFSLSEKSISPPVPQCSELKEDVARQSEHDIKNDVQATTSSSPSSNDKLCSILKDSGVGDAHVKSANLPFKPHSSPPSNMREGYRSRDITTSAINKAIGSLNNVPNLLSPRERKSFSLGVFDSLHSDGIEKRSSMVEGFQRVGVGYDSTVPPPNHQNFKTSVLKVVDQIRTSTLKHHPSGRWNDTLKRSHDKGGFSYELFLRLYSWKKVEVLPFGLVNCGNSCYANVVLQCLTFTPALTAYLIQRIHSQKCGRREWCFTCEFESLILKAKEGKSIISPIGILSQIGKISEHLGVGKEEDAHEFLRYAIDAMQSNCVKEVSTSASKSSTEDATLVNLTFGGYLQSKIKCGKCGGKSERHERMMDLTVEIEGDIRSLEEALRKFTTTEILDGDNKYKCSRCMSHEKAKKKLTILEAPNVLTIVLKRFQSGKFGKLNKSIRFPETLDMAPYMCRTSDKSPIFSLYGVVVHLDIMNASFSGHYVCYVKNVQNKWFKIDDGTVKAVEREGVLTKGAYMLFYSRCSPRAVRDVKTSKSYPQNNTKRVPSPHNSWSYSEDYLCEVKARGIFDTDTSSDSSSLISGSDEGSSTTEGSSDTTSSGDLSEYIFRGVVDNHRSLFS